MDIEVQRKQFVELLRLLKQNAVLLRKQEGGYQAVFATEDFVKMIECDSEDEVLKLIDVNGFIDMTHPGDRLAVRRMLRRKIGQDGTTEITVRKLTKTGKQIWCNIHFSFMSKYDEEYVYCTYFDVTHIKEYEARLKSAYAQMGDSFYRQNEHTLSMLRVNVTLNQIEDMQGRALYGTDSMERPYSECMKIRSENMPIPVERKEFLHNFSREKLIADFQDGNTHVEQTVFTKRRDGSFCYARYVMSLTRHPVSGDVIAFVTEQECNDKKTEDTLITKILSRQFDMVTFLANGRYGVVIGDASLITKGSIFPHERQGEYIEWLENRVIPVLDGTEDEKDEMAEALEPETIFEALKVQEPYVVNIRIRIDGEVYHKRCDFYTVDKDAEFYILLKSDTTEIHKEQTERNTQLIDALKEAEQANVAKTAFLSRMSHEIRTPMNAIIGLDNIALQDPELTDSVRENLEKIGDSAHYLLGLINDILDMSRIESGRMTLRHEDFSFGNFLDQVNMMVDGQCRNANLHYECVIHGKVNEHYIGDEMKLKQVLINILGNAVKFTPAGGAISMDVEQTGSYGEQAMLRFTIRDNGIGMDPKYIPRIFDAFSQEDYTTRSSYGGSGLGLAITKNMVDMMNGSIFVDSEKGQGSTFVVEVPLKNPEKKLKSELYIRPQELRVLEIDDDPVALKHAQIVLEEIDFAGRKVLLAEDVLINAEIMKQILLMRGMEVTHTENGRLTVEAFAKSEPGTFDVILMDVRMPEMDGLEATAAIRALSHPDAKTVPIIAMTANAFDEDVQRSLQAGMNAHLSKPVEPEHLFATMSDLIRTREA